ncbi:hypothetical protein K502DRAFT_323718 [Neoconidiobolus thromboides FSU 785]|nr:hypothetical protein K502DRAFT_323718 [Neoconidiobolus thromboides FSU 785]
MPFRFNPNPSVQQHYRSKSVCILKCSSCQTYICNRGMKAMLLADTKKELYSTDAPPKSVQLIEEDYVTPNCRCRIRNVACLGCGNEIGYHITQPCIACLESCNNGHFWMFHTDSVYSEERMDSKNNRTLLWTVLALNEYDYEFNNELEVICR